MNNMMTLVRGENTYFAEWEPNDTWSYVLRVYDVTDNPVRFVGKVITNDVTAMIDHLVSDYIYTGTYRGGKER